jgi:Ser/Thr protein kinase RdoA (MazF antagonist)
MSNLGKTRPVRDIHRRAAFKAGVSDFLAGLPHAEKAKEQLVYEYGRLTAAHMRAAGRKISGPADVHKWDAWDALIENSYPFPGWDALIPQELLRHQKA